MKKNTKRTLVATLLVMLLSLTVLIGSTYAYFNDTGIITGDVTTGTLDTELYYAYADYGTTLPSFVRDGVVDDDNHLDVSQTEGFTFEIEDYKPGDYTNIWFKFKNVASLHYTLAFTFAATEDTTVDLLSQFVYKFTTYTSASNYTIADIENDASAKKFYNEGNFVFADDAVDSYDVDGANGEYIDEEEEVYVCFQIKMINTVATQNKYQDKTAAFTIKFEAKQLTGEFVAPGSDVTLR
ncbi:MAG: hypothetical protein J6V68_01190 [Clostridia bacterium]|nr:hypothetical protein [Clostridia bacterium]